MIERNKKHCENCRHLEYYEADYYESSESGFSCNKRDFLNSEKESEFLKKLDTEKYRLRSKVCCDIEISQPRDEKEA